MSLILPRTTAEQRTGPDRLVGPVQSRFYRDADGSIALTPNPRGEAIANIVE